MRERIFVYTMYCLLLSTYSTCSLRISHFLSLSLFYIGAEEEVHGLSVVADVESNGCSILRLVAENPHARIPPPPSFVPPSAPQFT